MRIGEEIADAGVAQQLIDSVSVAAFREPDPLRPPAEVPGEFQGSDFDLRALRISVNLHQWHEAVRGRAGDEFQLAGIEKAPETVDEIVVILIDEHIAA